MIPSGPGYQGTVGNQTLSRESAKEPTSHLEAADGQDPTKKFRKELNSGMMSLAVLGLVVRSTKPMYGYEIGQRLAQASEDEASINQGAIYPVLRSLEKSGLLTSHVEPSISGPPRKYYSATPLGRTTFKDWKAVWGLTRNWVDQVLEPKHEQRPRNAPRRSPLP